MTSAVENIWDSLTADEAEFVQAIMAELDDRPWAAPLLAGIRDNGGVAPLYEIPGEGQSTIDSGLRATGNAGASRW